MLRRGEVGCRTLNDHGNYIIDRGKIMEKSWNFVFEFLWEPCTYYYAIFLWCNIEALSFKNGFHFSKVHDVMNIMCSFQNK